jgi:itaconyl-CoA hydratase
MTATTDLASSARPASGPDFSGYDVVVHGRKFEDFEVGQVLDHHWGRTLTESDVVTFATATCHWQPLYLNRQFALAHGHPDLVVPPMLALCTVVGVSVEDLSETGGPFLGLGECTFERSLHVGDTLTARSTVLAARLSDSRPGVGIVTWRTEAFHQTGARALSYVRTNLVACRSKEPSL